jgi:hypothetical protein
MQVKKTRTGFPSLYMLCYVCLFFSLCVKAMVVDRFDASLTDKLDDVQVLSLGTKVSELMYGGGGGVASAGGEGGDGGEGLSDNKEVASGEEVEVGAEGEAVATQQQEEGGEQQQKQQQQEQQEQEQANLQQHGVGPFGTSVAFEAALVDFGAAVLVTPQEPSQPLLLQVEDGEVVNTAEAEADNAEAQTATTDGGEQQQQPQEVKAVLSYETKLERMALSLAKDLKRTSLLKALVKEARRGGGANSGDGDGSTTSFFTGGLAEQEEVAKEETRKKPMRSRFFAVEDNNDKESDGDGGGGEDEDLNSWRLGDAVEAEEQWRTASKLVKGAKDSLKLLEEGQGLELGAKLQYHPLSQACYSGTFGGFEYQVRK